jgi:hypothetical protein
LLKKSVILSIDLSIKADNKTYTVYINNAYVLMDKEQENVIGIYTYGDLKDTRDLINSSYHEI